MKLYIKKDQEDFLSIWNKLSGYTHFSSKFLDVIIKRPDFLFRNDLDEELLRKCVNLVFTLFDVLCAVLAVRFARIRDKIRGILDGGKRTQIENLN